MFETIKRAYENVSKGQRATHIRESSKWGEVKCGTKFQLIEQTAQGIKVEKKFVDRYEHIDTGEAVDTYRQDVTTEWYPFEKADEWPEYARRLYNGEREVWAGDTDELLGFRGMMMGATWFAEE